MWGLKDLDEDGGVVNSAKMTIMGHSKYINSVKVSPNNKLIATASQDKTVKLWSSEDLMQKMQLNGHKSGVWDIAFSPVEKLLASASGDNSVKVWNLADGVGTCVKTLEGHATALVRI